MSLHQFTGSGIGFGLPPHYRLSHELRRYSPQAIPTVSIFTSGAGVQPFARPWTLTDDDWGVPYTAGRVGVLDRLGVLGAGDYETKIDAFIAANTTPVPGVLPSGYTARIEHDCAGPLEMGTATCDITSANYTRYMGESGPVANLWVPYSAAQARGYTKSSTLTYHIEWVSVVTPISAWAGFTLETGARGWREITWTWRSPTLHLAPPHPIAGTATMYISHNADGSTVSTSAHFGDTIDYSRSFDWTDYSPVDAGGGFWYYETPVYTTGPIAPTLGTPSNYCVTVLYEETEYTTAPGLWGADIVSGPFVGKMSPTDDIPFRWTCCGDDDLIAPGGLVT